MKKLFTAAVILLSIAVLFCGCGKNSSEVDLLTVMSKIEEDVQLPQNMQDITASDLERLYNVTSSEYSQFAGKISTVGISGDEIVIIEAANKDAAKSIKEKMDQRYQSKLNEMENYMPDEFKKIQSGGVFTSGNYIALLVTSDQDSLVDIFEGM